MTLIAIYLTGQKSKTARMLIIIIIVSVVAAIACLFGMTICFKWRRSIQKTQKTTHEPPTGILVSLVFDLKTLKAATGNFSDANKLGEGGFGPVYKGVLPDGQKIAVKKLSSRAGQGLTELKNEVGLVAKLEHRNLARLLGFCIEEEQKMVVYEYLPNTSLDKFLFDPVKRLLLSWERRYNLIEGITRGLIYLHEESQLRIIHRDLKASNILLDEHMSPKIADFGLAKLFGADDVTHGHTKRIAGTLGYMPPEYAINGRFSTKVDVFGFGVLTLEIVTGRRNGSLDEYSGNASNLISYVWCHWNKGSPLKVLDPTLERYQSHQVIRCIHIALLCVQQDPSKRPSMSTVGLMLSSSSMMVPPPSTPAFLSGHNETSGTSNTHFRDHNGSSVSKKKRPRQNMDHQRVLYSVNEVTVTDVDPR
ncbi:hypothetical protein Taro_029765 [Colocasia esculenta]|uniref:Protein kinase domain-containing protein n=1 Tax=Colocasia esculenta TaxID=4460 RepID=A0A843VEM6_COLES|nr:hypothetical protein [Colocasia esculenta]